MFTAEDESCGWPSQQVVGAKWSNPERFKTFIAVNNTSSLSDNIGGQKVVKAGME